MVNIWSTIIQHLGASCALCGAPADGLCASCATTLPRNDNPCPGCALPLPATAPRASMCAGCQSGRPAYDRAFAPLIYAPPVDDLVAGFKYHHRLPLGRLLADILAEALRDRPGAPPPLLLPIPATPHRLRDRGFNQAGELARGLAARLGIPWSGRNLLRVREVEPQRGLSRAQRRRNLRGAFVCRGRVPGQVALIDDVITTGATAEAAARALRNAGVSQIEVWAVARTPLECAS